VFLRSSLIQIKLKGELIMNYYSMVVAAARMIGKVNAGKKDVKRVLLNVLNAMGKKLDDSQFNEAYKQWNQSNGSKGFRPIYA
jgi:hypothetical protein